MIQKFNDKNLRRFFEDGETKGIEQSLIPSLAGRLDALHAATVATDLNLPGFDFHQLKGDRRGTWSERSAATGV